MERAIFDEGKDGEKDARVKKVEKPEAPEDEKREKSHLLDSFETRTALLRGEDLSVLSSSFFKTFSLKREFFMLTALMMQKMITAFSQSFVPSKCSILNRYFSLRWTREASSKERICSASFSKGSFHDAFYPFTAFYSDVAYPAI